jgi:hypothetical protein
MSITALEMIADALRLVNVIDEVKAPSAEQSANGLRTMNQMLADWERDGIRLGWHVVLSTNDTLPIEAADERGVKYNLACEFAGEYGIEPSAKVQQICDETFARLSKGALSTVVADLSGLPGESASIASAWPMG